MAGVGILYLLFQENVLEQSNSALKDKMQQTSWPIARTVIGAQVWLGITISDLSVV